jgi:uncharacterized membrane protein YgdD (TMEM256/DUF423 family)
MNKFFLQSGSIIGLLGVAIGAFGAHAFKNMLTESNQMDNYQTAVKYQFIHALALILVGILSKEFDSKTITYSGNCFLAGILIFSGSLYLICFTGIKTFGAIAPIGGTLLVLGWGLLFWSVYKNA